MGVKKIFFSLCFLLRLQWRRDIKIQIQQRKDDSFIRGDFFDTKINSMAGVAKLLGKHVINRAHKEVDLTNRKYKGTIFGLYFSAHW